jgi:hypothetical protein
MTMEGNQHFHLMVALAVPPDLQLPDIYVRYRGQPGVRRETGKE